MNRIEGIIPPLVTPLLARDTLDTSGLTRVVERVLSGGVSGVFALGTTGEAPSLSYRLRREVIQRVCSQVANHVPVLVGITDTSFVESVSLAKVAADAGATAVVVSTPYYFPAGQKELVDYVRNLVRELPLPLMLYNMPALTKVSFEVETLRELADLDAIVGVKDSSGDLGYFKELLLLAEARADWSIYMGPEMLLVDAVKLGGQGGVNSGANLFPKLFVRTYDAVIRGDQSTLVPLEAKIESLQRIYRIGKYSSRIIKATKSALSLLGICSDFMAEPFHRFREEERALIQNHLVEIGLGDRLVEAR